MYKSIKWHLFINRGSTKYFWWANQLANTIYKLVDNPVEIWSKFNNGPGLYTMMHSSKIKQFDNKRSKRIWPRKHALVDAWMVDIKVWSILYMGFVYTWCHMYTWGQYINTKKFTFKIS